MGPIWRYREAALRDLTAPDGLRLRLQETWLVHAKGQTSADFLRQQVQEPLQTEEPGLTPDAGWELSPPNISNPLRHTNALSRPMRRHSGHSF